MSVHLKGIPWVYDHALRELRRPSHLSNLIFPPDCPSEIYFFDPASEDGSRTTISISSVESPGRYIEIGTLIDSEIEAQIQASPLSPDAQERIQQLRESLERTVWTIPFVGTCTGRLSTFIPPYHDFKQREEARAEPLDTPNPELPRYKPR